MKKMIRFFITGACILYSEILFSQLRFQNTFGGINNDWSSSMQLTNDGGYVMAGYSENNTCIVRIDNAGHQLWEKTFGGVNSSYANCVKQTFDQGFIITGLIQNGTNSDVYVIKTDSSGNLQWSKTYGGIGDDHGKSIVQTADNGYVITGSTLSFGAGGIDVYLLKINGTGDTLWTKTFGGIHSDVGNSVIETSDSGYVILGFTQGSGTGSDIYMIKTTSNGDTIWTKTIDITLDEGYGVSETRDKGFILTGTCIGTGGPGDQNIFLLKTDSLGNADWLKSYDTGFPDYGFYAEQTTDSGYIIAGYTEGASLVIRAAFVIKTNSTGDTLWTKAFGSNLYNEANAVHQTADGGFAIGGGWDASFSPLGNSGFYFIKTDSNGTMDCNEALPATTVSVPTIQSLYTSILISTGASINLSDTTSSMLSSQTILCSNTDIIEMQKRNSFQLFPNPSNGNFTISLNEKSLNSEIQIFNLYGVKIYENRYSDTTTMAIYLSNCTQGIYFAKILSKEKQYIHKVIIVQE